MKSFKNYLNSDTINEVSYGKGSNAIVTDIMKDPVEGLAKELLDIIGKRIWISSAYRDEYNQARVVYGNWKRKGGANGGRQYLLNLYGNDNLAGKVADAYEAGTNKKDSIAKAEAVLLDAIAKGDYMSNHQLENAIDISSYEDSNGKKRGLSRSEYKKIKDFIKGGSSNYAVKVVDEGDHVHIKLNIKGGGSKGKKSTASASTKTTTDIARQSTDKDAVIKYGSKGDQVKQIQQTLVNLKYDLGTYGPNGDGVDGNYGQKTSKAIQNFQERNKLKSTGSLDALTYAKLSSPDITKLKGPSSRFRPLSFVASLFKNGLKLKIQPSEDGVTATAIEEKINSFYSLDDYVTEGILDNALRQAVLKHQENKPRREQRRKERKERRALRKQIRAVGKGKSTGILGDTTDDTTQDEIGIENNKSTFTITRDKNTGVYTLNATNDKAIKKLGGANSIIVTNKKDIRVLNNGFKVKDEVKTTTPTTDTPYVPGGPTSISHRYSGAKASNIKLLEDAAKKRGITNPVSLIGILSVIGKESGFVPKSEIPYRNTSNSRIRHIFGGKLNDGGRRITDAELDVLKADDKAFFDRVYGGKYGNASDEGYKYRGRGFNGITFKGNYKKYGGLIGKDLIGNPDLLNDNAVAADAAVSYFTSQLAKKGIDPNSFTSTKDAIQTFAHANAGWGKSPTGTVVNRATTNATKISNNFSIA